MLRQQFFTATLLADKRQECAWNAHVSALSFLPDVSFAEIQRHFFCEDLLDIWNISFYYFFFKAPISLKESICAFCSLVSSDLRKWNTKCTKLGLRCHHVLRNTSCLCLQVLLSEQGSILHNSVPFKTNSGPFLVHLITNLAPFWSLKNKFGSHSHFEAVEEKLIPK